jgi:hypothetical protein
MEFGGLSYCKIDIVLLYLIFIAAMKSRSALIFILFSLSIIFQNCGEPDDVYESVKPHYYDWGGFKSGTWWVYEEKSLGIYDTINIYEHFRGYSQIKDPSNHFLEVIDSYFASSRGIDSGRFHMASYGSGILMIHKYDDLGEHSRLCCIVRPPPVQGDVLGYSHPGQFVLFDTIYSTYKIGNLEFHNVVRANDNFNYFYLGTSTLIYQAKNIGIIRKEFPEFNQVWNLVDYHIIQ